VPPFLSLLWKRLQMQIVNCKSSLWSRIPNYKSPNSDHNLQIVRILSNNVSQIASVMSLIKISKLTSYIFDQDFQIAKVLSLTQFPNLEEFYPSSFPNSKCFILFTFYLFTNCRNCKTLVSLVKMWPSGRNAKQNFLKKLHWVTSPTINEANLAIIDYKDNMETSII